MAAGTVILRAAAGALLVLVIAAPRASVAQEPPSIRLLSSKTSLTPSDLARIRDYAQYWAGKLNSAGTGSGNGDANASVDIRPIRKKLVDPIRSGSTEVFRDAYGREALPMLASAVDTGNAQQSVTAIIVVSQFGTKRALDMLVDHCSIVKEPRRHVRLAAARGCAFTLNRAGEATAPKDIVSAAREIAAAATNENDPYALRHQVEALLAALERGGDANTEKITTALVEAIQATANRAKKTPDAGDALGFLSAVYPVMNKLRGRFFTLQEVGGAKKAFGISFGPCLQNVLTVAEARWAELFARWAELQGDEKEKLRLGNIIQLCETFLGAIDVVVRAQASPNTRLKQAWADGDQARYSRDLKKWHDILTRPPY